ncbi:MAG: hypothetical protein ACJ8F4_04890 [Sphingomonas sp.]
MIGRAAFVAASAVCLAGTSVAKPVGCADHWKVELNRESFAHNGAGRNFTAAELTLFRARLDAQLKSAIAAGCRQGRVKEGDAKKIKRVQISSASGANEPTLYLHARGSLAFEWAFAEEKLAIPPAKEILAGSACWTSPRSTDCLESGD